MITQPLALAARNLNLKRIFLIRSIVVAGQILATLYAYFELELDLNYSVIITAIVFTTFTLVGGFFRLQKPWPITQAEYFSHLLVEILIFSVLLYYTGGSTNPFISYYLVPLCISAATLPLAYTWSLTGVCLLFYSLMLFFYIPVPLLEPAHAHHLAHNDFLNFHIIGMWFNFAISAILITFFVVKMANALRQQETVLTKTREDHLRDEQILAVATLAAGTAHELGTPLSTMAVLTHEMAKEHKENSALVEDIEILKNQVTHCKNILRNLVNTAEKNREGVRDTIALTDYINNVLDQWQLLQPGTQTALNILNTEAIPKIEIESTVTQAILNILNNAADASPEKIDITLDWNKKFWLLCIRDYGPGISLEIAEQVGEPFFTTKGKGLGLGLFLTHATVSRYAGHIKLWNHNESGTVTELQMPFRFS